MIGATRILVGWGERTNRVLLFLVVCRARPTGHRRARPTGWHSAGTRLVLGWYSAGTRLVLDWYSTGTRRTLDWYSAGTRRTRGWYSTDTRLVLDWYSTGTRRTLDGHSTDTRRTLDGHSAGTRLALDGHSAMPPRRQPYASDLYASDLLEAGLPRWKIESPSRSPRHPNSYVSSCKKFLCHCLLVTLGAVDGCERASFERF